MDVSEQLRVKMNVHDGDVFVPGIEPETELTYGPGRKTEQDNVESLLPPLFLLSARPKRHQVAETAAFRCEPDCMKRKTIGIRQPNKRARWSDK